MSINWNDVLGLRKVPQRQEKLQQNNERSSETLADEAKNDPNGEATSSGNTPLPSQANQDNGTNETAGSEDGADTSTDSEDPSLSDPESGETPDDQGAGQPDSSSTGSEDDPSNGDENSSTDEDSDPESSADSEPGKDPLRLINGKARLAEDIRDLISEVESVLESLERISFESPAVVKLGELKEDAELLLQSVPGITVEDTMVRYELLVRQFSELSKQISKA